MGPFKLRLLSQSKCIGDTAVLRWSVLSNSSIGVLTQRNQYISEIARMGRSNWCRQSGYYVQSHVENTLCRFKRIIGGWLRSKHDEAQKEGTTL